MPTTRNNLTVMLLLALTLLAAGCGTFNKINPSRELPPILREDELLRPYIKLGRIQVIREVYGIVDYMPHPDIRQWGLNSIREEADKMGADAVVSPEVSGTSTTYLLLPSTEYRASGVAIKFK